MSFPVLPRAVFLDRDGTLIEDRHYLADPEGVTLLPGVIDALSGLAAAGCRFFVVSNQSGIGRGYFSEADVCACQARLDTLLAGAGLRLEDSVWCPHAPEVDCRCRKPLPGLWERLREKHGLTPGDCVMVGDKRADVGFAVNAGFAAGFLVLSGKGGGERQKLGWPEPRGGVADVGLQDATRIFVAEDLPAVARFLLEPRELAKNEVVSTI